MTRFRATLSMAFFGGGLWKNYGDYLRHKSTKLHSQLRVSVSASRKEEAGASSNATNTSYSSVYPFRSEEEALCFIEQNIRSPSGLFSSLVFFIDGPQRLRLVETSSSALTNNLATLQASSAQFAHRPLALCPPTKTLLLDDELLRRFILAHGGLISIGMGTGVTHVLTENVAVGNQRWRLFR